VLTRRVRYRDLRRAIRRVCANHLSEATQGRVTPVTSDPLVMSGEISGVRIQGEVRLNEEEIELHLLPIEAASILEGMRLGLSGWIEGGLEVSEGRLRIAPLKIAYERLRPALFALAKRKLPELVRRQADAEFEFSGWTIGFRGSKTPLAGFDGRILFEEREIALELNLRGAALLFSPVVASRIDAQLSEWTDGWTDKMRE
jgi:hypothetical protein